MESSDDLSLLRAVADRDEKAFQQIYQRHSSMLFSLAYRILGNASDAEDVLQETFVQVWKTAAAFDPGRSKPVSWLILLTRSRAIDRLRARQSRARIIETAAKEDPAEVAKPEREVASMESHQIIRRALQSLPEEQRVPLELAYFGGLSQTEIAGKLAAPLGTIKTRMRSAMLRLRDELGSVGLGTEERP